MKSNPFSTRFVAPGVLPWFDDSESLNEIASRFTRTLHSRAAIVGPHGSGKSTLLEHLVPLIGKVVSRYRVGIDALDAADITGHLAAACDASSEHVPHRRTPVQKLVPDRLDLVDQVRFKEHLNAAQTETRSVVWLSLRDSGRSAEVLRIVLRAWRCRGGLLVVDGYEQLRLVARVQLLIATYVRQQGLLLTSHRATWLPTLVKREVDVRLAVELVEHLLGGAEPILMDPPSAATLGELLQKHGGDMREVLMELYDRAERATRVRASARNSE